MYQHFSNKETGSEKLNSQLKTTLLRSWALGFKHNISDYKIPIFLFSEMVLFVFKLNG